MKKNHSIAFIELNSIAKGILTVDAMLKHSPVAMVRSGSVHNGKYLILVGGSVASVEEAFRNGIRTGKNSVTDSIFLPDVHESVFEAVSGNKGKCSGESIAALETFSVPSVIRASDSAIKGADIDIVEIRMADDLGGKGVVIFTGRLEEVEAAVGICRKVLSENNSIIDITIIPRPVEETSGLINTSTIFKDSIPVLIRDGEK